MVGNRLLVVKEILPLLAQRPRLMAHMEALVRVDDRRWDLRLKDGTVYEFPAYTPLTQQLEALKCAC